MALKITRASDPITVDRLNLTLYGPPGVGKSSLAFTAASPLLLDFDSGSHRAANRKDVVRVGSWDDVAGMTGDDLSSYATVIVDTAGRALDVLSADIIAKNPKMGRGGALTLQGFGELKAKFVAWLKMLNSFGKDVVLITHMDEQRNGDEIIERLDVQGGSKGEIYKAADAMGRLTIRNGKRMLNFSPTDAAFGKNPGQLEALEIQHPDRSPDALAQVIASIKAKLNEQTAEAQAEQKRVEALRASLSNLTTADQFNEKVTEMAEALPKDKALLMAAAEATGLSFDKKAKKFLPAVKDAA